MFSSISCDRLRTRALAWPAVAVATFPRAVSACPQCYGSEPTQVLNTYYLSTLLLSVLPVILLGALVAVGFSVKRQMEATANRRAAELPL
jgi:hypothetical protein